MQQSDAHIKPQPARKRASKPPPRETAQEVIRDFFATLARIHAAPGGDAEEKP